MQAATFSQGLGCLPITKRLVLYIKVFGALFRLHNNGPSYRSVLATVSTMVIYYLGLSKRRAANKIALHIMLISRSRTGIGLLQLDYSAGTS